MSSSQEQAARQSPLQTLEAKRDEAYRLALDGMDIVHVLGTEAVALVDPIKDERVTYFILHWPALDARMAALVRFWVKELFHAPDDRDMTVKDYMLPETDVLKEVTDFSDYAPRVIDRDTFDPGIVNLAALPTALEDHLFTRVLESAEQAELLARISRSIPTDH